MAGCQGDETTCGTHDGDDLRLAIIGSPRSGNTWLRTLLGAIFDLEQIGVHDPDKIDWDALPRRCVVQIHWLPEPAFVDRLRRHGVRVIATARHPLDVLMSSLNYSFYVHLVAHCPGGGVCNECGIAGQSPRSPQHMAYACGEAGRLLLSYSRLWWARPEVIRARYEDLVAAPEATLAGIVRSIGREPARSIAATVEATAIARQKTSPEAWHCHFWKGRPGLWRSLLPPEEARRIAAANPEPFETLGYACDPDESLDGARADLNWLRLQLDTTRDNLAHEAAKHRRTADELAGVRRHLDQVLFLLWEERQFHAATKELLTRSTAPGRRPLRLVGRLGRLMPARRPAAP